MRVPYPWRVPPFVSYAQNGEDVRAWHAFGPRRSGQRPDLVFVEVGANEPWRGSVTGALYQLGWRGLLVEPDPELAARLRTFRPEDAVVEAAAAYANLEVPFFRVPGTGLGTLDPGEAQAARDRGFLVEETTVRSARLDDLLDDWTQTNRITDIHLLSIDVEGAEQDVLAGLSLSRHRPWVVCIEAVAPGTSTPTHERWQIQLLTQGYREMAFDGVNRWYVAEEHADKPILSGVGDESTTIAQAIATPFHVIDIGAFGWVTAETSDLRSDRHRSTHREAWQRELLIHDLRTQVPTSEYLRQIDELRSEVVAVKGSRTYQMARHVSRVSKKLKAHVMRLQPPDLVAKRMVRERHLRHVTTNMRHLTDPAYLGTPDSDLVTWAQSADADARPPLPPGLEFAGLRNPDEVRSWLANNVWDSDEQLDSRMDNHNDEVGRVRSALRTRLRVADIDPSAAMVTPGADILVDARCLQTPAFGHRGIGRFAASVLNGVRAQFGDDRVVLLVDRALEILPSEIAGTCRQITRIHDPAGLRVLIQPSPMTHDPAPLLPILASGLPSLAVVFDFIPLHYPTIYLKHVADRVEYAARLDALRHYSTFVGISHTALGDMPDALGIPTNDERLATAAVAWPDEIRGTAGQASPGNGARTGGQRGPIILMTGDEPRKNTFGGLAGIAAATSDEVQRDVRVVGMAGQDTRVHHWSIAAAMRPGEAQTLPRLADEELHTLLASASCVVVPSFDEGLSLPVIEAVRAGTPVVASDIPSHRELIGSGTFTCDPRSPRSIAAAVRKARGRWKVAVKQQRSLDRHSQESLPNVVCAFVINTPEGSTALSPQNALTSVARREQGLLDIGILTPWTPQPSGVADFSATVFTHLAEHANVTIYSTADADVANLPSRLVEEVFDDPAGVQQRHDALITVVGNSHFHLPFVGALGIVDSLVVAHDTRMVEYYLALRGLGGATEVLTRTADPEASRNLDPPLEDQIRDMRLLQNAGMWEIARRARKFIVHSPSAAGRLERETGTKPTILPFATQRVPHMGTITPADRQQARERLGLEQFPAGTIHLGNFGYVDVRTKLTDVVIEAAGWLSDWGHTVALHLVGAAPADVVKQIEQRARDWGIQHIQVTGFQSEERFRDWLLAVDLGIQLRVSPLLGVSGPLSDLAAFGTPAVASRGLCMDVDPPAYIRPLPDNVSPVLVAEVVEETLANPVPPVDLEVLRRGYLEAKSPARYSQQLLTIIEEVIA